MRRVFSGCGDKDASPKGSACFYRDPYMIHLNIALQMVVSNFSWVEQATCFKWWQNASIFSSEPDFTGDPGSPLPKKKTHGRCP